MADINDVIRRLFGEGIILFGDFKLTSGLESPYYIDLRLIYSKPSLLKMIVELYIEELKKIDEYDVLSGIESGSIALAAILSYLLAKPMIYVRKKAKDFGTEKLIEGKIDRGDIVVVIDDVATTGGSILRAIKSIREAGGIVNDAVVFIDRAQGAREALARERVRLHAVLDTPLIMRRLLEMNIINRETFDRVMRYIGGRYV